MLTEVSGQVSDSQKSGAFPMREARSDLFDCVCVTPAYRRGNPLSYDWRYGHRQAVICKRKIDMSLIGLIPVINQFGKPGYVKIPRQPVTPCEPLITPI